MVRVAECFRRPYRLERHASRRNPDNDDHQVRFPTLDSLTRDPALRFGIRATISALIAFSLTRVIQAPLHGLWAVLTAVVVLQMSAGGSIRATLNYVLGTFAGAVYASILSLLIPHATPLAMAGVLALAVGPLAWAAARSPVFRVAPFTGVIVLLLAGQFGQTPITAALVRLLEVAFGGGVAVAVSLLILPERAHSVGRRQAAAALRCLAETLPGLLTGFRERADPEQVLRLQDRAGTAVTALVQTLEEEEHEKFFRAAAQEALGPLSRTLLRLRHDLVIIGRAAAMPLPARVGEQLLPLISGAGTSVGRYMDACADALDKRKIPPASDEPGMALDACGKEIDSMRREGLTRDLSGPEVEQLFALGFVFEELRRNLVDLERCVRAWAVL
jgi:uncharacterized membrane protein YccC